MKIVITSKKPVLTAQGRLPAGVSVDVPDQLGIFLINEGLAVLLETKEQMDRPTQTVGMVEQSSVSPAVLVSPQTTLKESESGKKRRGRPPKALLLQTPPSE